MRAVLTVSCHWSRVKVRPQRRKCVSISGAMAWAASEMSAPVRSRELDVLAALSHHTYLSLGCYCRDESRCHRSLLRALLAERGADLA